jgi:hypothetical protein
MEDKIKTSSTRVLHSVNIETVENGFILTENPGNGHNMEPTIRPKHVFESKESLYSFMDDNLHTNATK